MAISEPQFDQSNRHVNVLSRSANEISDQGSNSNHHDKSVSNGSSASYHHGHANGHSNGYTNVHMNGHANGHTSRSDHHLNETPVAICGMAMRLPGGIRNDADLYQFLLNKRDARSVVGQDKYNIDGYYSSYGQTGTVNTKQGYFLDYLDYSNIDLSMFSFNGAEAEQLDPNHRLVLEMVREAFENAGESEWQGKNIGTYVGLFTEDWQEMAHRDNQDYNTHRILGGTDFALPNRIAYEYDLKGPR